MELKLCGDGRGRKLKWMGMETKSAGTGGDGCDFCPRAGLYLPSAEILHFYFTWCIIRWRRDVAISARNVNFVYVV